MRTAWRSRPFASLRVTGLSLGVTGLSLGATGLWLRATGLSLRVTGLSLGVTGLVLLLGCASTAPQQKTAPLDEPEIHISQLSNVSEAARHIAGSLSVQFRVDIGNRANVPITIKRIEVISLGAGAYTLRPTSYPFDQRLNAGEATAVQFWVPANIDDPTIIGANGPVSVRLTMQYQTPAGMTQSIVVQQVHALSGLN